MLRWKDKRLGRHLLSVPFQRNLIHKTESMTHSKGF
ncbi:BgTH12-06334 [Blumeria graminis f. sp. triticale]|uniref:BgTH12-06334 n=1 Tax=Blumeria graminis f. sp. triticale TaxID=1689686 RepID=A0A9W4D3H7_BLUGR|nr:BgTH12-06334 [Blumeria graminis f. sp. triticale]